MQDSKQPKEMKEWQFFLIMLVAFAAFVGVVVSIFNAMTWISDTLQRSFNLLSETAFTIIWISIAVFCIAVIVAMIHKIGKDERIKTTKT